MKDIMKGLNPKVIELAKAHLKMCMENGLPIVIIKGLRTVAEQDALFEQGRTTPGPIVTNARGGHSFHNFGLAYDVCLLTPNGRLSWDMRSDMNGNDILDFIEIGNYGKIVGLEWGGNFKSIIDMPHFQYTFGFTLAQLREGVEIPNE